MSYVDFVLSESITFLDDFIVKKVNDICNHLTLFYNYLSIPREGFKIVKKPFWVGTTKCIKVLNDNEKRRLKVNTLRCERPVVNKFFCELHSNAKLEDNITSEIVSTKRINKEMVTYLFNEIYNCKNFTTTTNIIDFVGRERQYIFTQIYKAIDERYTTRSIKDVLYSYLNDYDILVENEVEKLIIKYVAICIYNMIFIDIGVDALFYKYGEMQRYVLDVKRDYTDFGLEDERYNKALQAFVYIIVALMDWLELDDLSIDEVETAFKIMLYSGYKNRIDKIKRLNTNEINSRMSDKDFKNKMQNYKSNVSLSFKNLNLYADETVSELILNYILLLTNIFYLDEKCELYSSKIKEVKQLHALLTQMFDGCYNYSLSYDSIGRFEGINISGKLKDNSYTRHFNLKDINPEKHTTINFSRDNYNFMILYTKNTGELEDIYVVEKQIYESRNKNAIDILEKFKAAVNNLTSN
jgi:hypothetical protein